MYGNGLLNVDVVRFSKHVLQFQVQATRFERAIAQLEKKKAIWVVPPLHRAYAFINHFRYAKKDEK